MTSFNFINQDYNYCYMKYSVYILSRSLENLIYRGVDKQLQIIKCYYRILSIIWVIFIQFLKIKAYFNLIFNSIISVI